MPEVRRIAKHRHVPRMIKKAAEAERVQRDKERRKVTVLFLLRVCCAKINAGNHRIRILVVGGL